jgi:hypothetical protein
MATATYVPLATQTLGSAASTITFSSIPATYTDLRLVLTGTSASSGAVPYIQFNGDTTSNYSMTTLHGDGTSATAYSRQSFPNLRVGYGSILGMDSTIHAYTFDIFSYANSTNKTVLSTYSEDESGTGSTGVSVGLWRGTAAVNSILIGNSASVNFNVGTRATLWGI